MVPSYNEYRGYNDPSAARPQPRKGSGFRVQDFGFDVYA